MTSKNNNIDNFIVADSSFYVCFLNDINQPQHLIKILTKLKFIISSCIINEISKRNNFQDIINRTKIVPLDREYKFTDILKPFVSKKQYEKGETEVIALAFILYRMDQLVKIIIDDSEPRKFIINKLNILNEKLTGTVGFLGECYYNYSVFDKKTALNITGLIKTSKFHVSQDILDKTIKKICDC